MFTFSTLSGVAAACRSKYSEFSRDFHISQRSTARALKALREEKQIEKVKDDHNDVKRSVYRYAGEPCSEGYIRADLFLFQQEFDIKGEGRRYLTLSEILVLAYIMTHCNDPKQKKFTGSIRSIAKKLNLAASTVQLVLRALLRGELIYRPVEDKAPNGSRWSVYHINDKLIRKKKKEYKKATEKQSDTEPQKVVYIPKDVAAADAKTDRDQFYSRARERASAPVEQVKKRLKADAEYTAAEKSWNVLEIPKAKAELYGTTEEVRKIKQKQAHWRQVMARRMAALNISPEDLIPRYRCVKCSDTGWQSDGEICDCYPKGRT